MSSTIFDVVIVGGGAAGLTAAIYSARALRSTAVYNGGGTEGQLLQTNSIENYPGFLTTTGYDLLQIMEKQAVENKATIVPQKIVAVDFSKYPFVLQDGKGQQVQAKSVIIATGAYANRLHLKDENKYWLQGGISACAVCDGSLPCFRNQPLAVVGGGDVAMEDALYLSRFASIVYLIHRSATFRASRILLDRVQKNDKIRILTYCTVTELFPHSKQAQKLGAIMVCHNPPISPAASTSPPPPSPTNARRSSTSLHAKQDKKMEVAGLFYAIGHLPQTSLFRTATNLLMDAQGYIMTTAKDNSTETSIAGVFACGDVSDKRYRQAVFAAGTGCAAAIDADRWLGSSVSSSILSNA